MSCQGCGAARAARAAAKAAQGSSKGLWELVPLSGTPTLHDNRLAAMAADLKSGGGGIIRKAPAE